MKWILGIICPCLLFGAVDYTFDDAGRLKTVQSDDGSLSYSYEYDNNNRVTMAHDMVQGTTAYRTLEDEFLNLFPEQFPMLQQEGVQYIYDPLERVSEAFLEGKF